MSNETAGVVMTPEQFLSHWQGHRRLTRRLIEAFPEDQINTFSVAEMRPFGRLVLEMLSIGVPMVRGIISGEWSDWKEPEERPKAGLLEAWDADTAELDALWPKLSADQFQVTYTAFGQYTGPLYDLLLYAIDNEIHHRGQAYVYLRALGIEPPAFWDRD